MSFTTMNPTILRVLTRAVVQLPRPILARLAGAYYQKPIDGYTVDEQIALILAFNDRFGPPPLEQTDPITARALFEDGFRPFVARPRPMAGVHDLTVSGGTGASPPVPMRVYTPPRARSRGPAVIFFHGGGGVIGSLDSYDAICRLIAAETGFVVISVAYRLAPEHRFPAGVDDAIASYHWVRQNTAQLDIDPERVAVCGDSMGGSLAAVVCQQVKAANAAMPALQVLLYPLLDMSFSCPSHQTLARGYLLTRELMMWFRGLYCSDEVQIWDLRASPLLAVDVAGLPPALIITGGLDPLRDEGHLYADRLQRAGVAVTYRCHDRLIHGFAAMTGVIDEARRAMHQMAADIRECLQ